MSIDILDLREIAREWQDALDEHEIDLEIALDIELDSPRFPRLQLAHAQRTAQIALGEPDVAKYIELAEQVCGGVDPADLEQWGNDYECTLIADDSFEAYAEELAEDIGAVPNTDRWPAYCIDWERAANELRQDYTSVTFDGTDYYLRSC